MATTIFLWANVLLYSFHFAGHLLNLTVNIPNWSTGEMHVMNNYANFYHKRNNTSYFAPIIMASILTCIGSLILVWTTNDRLRNLLIADLIIVVGVLISVFSLFRPINQYFFAAHQYDQTQLKLLVHKWLFFNSIRFVVVFLGLVLAIWAINEYTAVFIK